MSKLAEYQAQLDKDLIIDPSHMLSEASGNILKHSTYHHKLLQWKAKLKAANLELLVIAKDRYNHYAGIGENVSAYNMDRTAIKYNLEGDHKVNAKERELMMIQLNVDFYTNACEMFKNRGFAIKNMIDIMKFEAGV